MTSTYLNFLLLSLVHLISRTGCEFLMANFMVRIERDCKTLGVVLLRSNMSCRNGITISVAERWMPDIVQINYVLLITCTKALKKKVMNIQGVGKNPRFEPIVNSMHMNCYLIIFLRFAERRLKFCGM